MTDLERLLRDTLADPPSALPVPADPVPGIKRLARQQRRRRLTVAVAAAAVLAAVLVPGGALTRLASRPPAPPAGTGSGLLPWPARGPLAGDTALRADAVAAWAASAVSDDAPASDVRTLYAGTVAGRRVVVLEGIVRAHRPWVAEVADAGPVGGRLDLVWAEPLPNPGPAAVAVLAPAGLSRTAALLVAPWTGDARLVLPRSDVVGDHRGVPADGLVEVNRDIAGQPVLLERQDSRGTEVIDLVPEPARLVPSAGPVRFVPPPAGWTGYPGGAEQDYLAGLVAADRIGAPVALSKLRGPWTYRQDRGTKVTSYDALVYSVVSGNREYTLTLALVDGWTPRCVQLTPTGDLTLAKRSVVAGRCPLPGSRLGLLWLATRGDIQGAHITMEIGRPGEASLELGGPREPFSAQAISDAPTGQVEIQVYDAGGREVERTWLPPYRGG